MKRSQDILSSPALRLRLEPRRYHYPHRLAVGRYLGYLKRRDCAPRWIAIGCTQEHKYIQTSVGKPDDEIASDGKSILTFQQALRAARNWFDQPDQHKILCEAHPIRHRGQLCICPIGDLYTVGHALRDYFEWKRATGSSEKSIQPSVFAANAYIVPLLGHRTAAELRTKDFRSFLTSVATVPKHLIGIREGKRRDFENLDAEAQLRGKKRANSVFATLRAALRHAWQRENIADDRPWKSVEIFKVHPSSPPFIPSKEHVKALLQASEPSLRNLIQVCYLTGCTLNEATRFTSGWLSQAADTLTIPGENESCSRTLPISRQASKFLYRALSQNSTGRLLFPRHPEEPWTIDGAMHRFAFLRKKVGLPKGFTFRSLRDAHVVALLSTGLSIAFVARQTGLSNGTVLNRYGYCVDDFIDRDLRVHYPFSFETEACGVEP